MNAGDALAKFTSRIRREGVGAAIAEGWSVVRTALQIALFSTRRRSFGLLGRKALIQRPRLLRGTRYMFVGDDVFVRDGGRIEAFEARGGTAPRLSIGKGTWIELDVQISCASSVSIGEDVLFGGRVFVSDNDHGVAPGSHRLYQQLRVAPVRLGDRVWVGQNACILKGVELGDDCVVAAGAVVTRSFPPRAIIAGVPARQIGSVDVPR